jgi:hypothetical protein
MPHARTPAELWRRCAVSILQIVAGCRYITADGVTIGTSVTYPDLSASGFFLKGRKWKIEPGPVAEGLGSICSLRTPSVDFQLIRFVALEVAA